MKINAVQWQQLSELLDTALELDETERRQWFASLPDHLTELKPTLQELLSQQATIETNDLLLKPPDFAAALLAESTHAQWATQELQVGNMFGAYRLLRELGRGGMGAVWLADRVDGKFKREVALKFPYAGPYQRQLAERLSRERDILAGLQHANIARMYDADTTPSGQPFLVLEYINGIAIHQYCDEQKLDVTARLMLFQQVLAAVRYAHSHFVVHRDIKPSNILITADGVVHLLDFGIATLITEGETAESPLTQFGGHVLTPEYASPEQISKVPVTTASDVYSLGVVLYGLLTGTSPYPCSREQRAQLEQAIANADVISPSRAHISKSAATRRNSQPTQLRRLLRGDLDTLLLKALKKDIDDRYASVDAFYEDIKRYLAHQPILAQPDSEWYRIKKFARRNRAAVASVAAIIIALLAGTGIALWQAHQASLQRDRAVASAARSEAVTDFLQTMMTDVGDADEPVTMQQLITRSEDIASRTYIRDTNQQAAVLEVLGNYYLSFNRPKDALRSLSNALQIANKNFDSTSKAKLSCMLASAQFQLGDTQAARKEMQVGIESANVAPHVMMLCLRVRAYLKYQDTDLHGALQDIQLAENELRISGVSDPASMAQLKAEAAQVYADLGRTSDAEHEYGSAIALLSSMGRGESRTTMDIQNSWAVNHDTNGDPRGALIHYDRAIEIARKRGMSKRDGEMYTANRAYALHQLGRDEEAVAAYRRFIDIADKNGNIYELLSAKQRLAATLISIGRIDEAKSLMNEISTMLSKDSDEISLQGMHALTGLMAMKQHRYIDVVIDFSTVIDYLVSHNMQGGYLASKLTLRGEAYLNLGKINDAVDDATKSYQIAVKIQGDFPYSNITGDAALLLAKIEAKRNQPGAARKWIIIAYQQLQGSLGDAHPSAIEAKRLLESI